MLSAQGIATRPFFPPLSSLPGVRGLARCRPRQPSVNRVGYPLATRGINLPSALMLSEADVDRVCGVVRALVASAPAVRPPLTKQGS